MTNPAPDLIPVLHQGVFLPAGDMARNAAGFSLRVVSAVAGNVSQILPLGKTGRFLIDPMPVDDLDVILTAPDGTDTSLQVQVGGWSGAVAWSHGGLVSGQVRNLRAPTQDQTVVAFDAHGVVAHATAKAAEGGQFLMVLPLEVTQPDHRRAITLGIAGSDYVLNRGQLAFGSGLGMLPPALRPVPTERRAIRLKISTPNLQEAPLWGDFHFAKSLAAAFKRIDMQADVDTADAWYAHSNQEDVVLTIRGRHRIEIDPAKINIMWLISHPDRIPAEEYADYDHIAVASDIYAAELKSRGLPSVSVLHQATDARLFSDDKDVARAPACLFVGNSRREYRTMVKWCLQKDIPLELYGGGWEGVLPKEALRASSVANADLAGVYGRHLILLNDHWDSMRSNGFLSNRLFDGSAVGTPIVTDPVAGLAEVFGDTISQAADIEAFDAIIKDCLSDPAPYLARAQQARDIVLAAHTFDHRARQLADIIERIATTKERRG